MKRVWIYSLLLLTGLCVHAQEKTLQLKPPTPVKGVSIMEAFRNRQFIREYQETDLSHQDLSDLLWAAWGINRDNGKRTAPTAQNSQDIDVYVCRGDGTWLYDAVTSQLVQVSSEDIRPLLEGRRPTGAPVFLLIVSDMSRYKGYTPDSKDLKHYYEMGAVDSGIVSQNISLYCAGTGLATGPRAGMNQEAIRKALNVTDTQYVWLNHPVGYPKE